MSKRKYKSKFEIKKDLMSDYCEAFESLADHDECLRACRAKSFIRLTKKTLMKDYKATLKMINKKFPITIDKSKTEDENSEGVSRGNP